MKKSLSEIKNSKPFSPFDLIIYCVLALAVVSTLFAVFFAEKTSENQGAYFLYDNTVVAEYEFKNDKFTIYRGFENLFSVTDNGIYFYPDETSHEHYNLIITDGKNKTVRITDANCAGRDCTKQKVTEKGGFIYCAPHKLKIIPIEMSDPVSG